MTRLATVDRPVQWLVRDWSRGLPADPSGRSSCDKSKRDENKSPVAARQLESLGRERSPGFVCPGALAAIRLPDTLSDAS
jgi:hypothetical protein